MLLVRKDISSKCFLKKTYQREIFLIELVSKKKKWLVNCYYNATSFTKKSLNFIESLIADSVQFSGAFAKFSVLEGRLDTN